MRPAGPFVRVRVAEDEADIAAAQAVRKTVFVDEQDVDPTIEQDGRDGEAIHLLAEVDRLGWSDGASSGALGVGLGARCVGAVRVLVEPTPQTPLAGLGWSAVGHLGRLAVLRELRGSGVGAALVRAVEGVVAGRGLPAVYLGAQVHALGFYSRLGYEPVGEEYVEAGIAHRYMVKVLEAQPEDTR